MRNTDLVELREAVRMKSMQLTSRETAWKTAWKAGALSDPTFKSTGDATGIDAAGPQGPAAVEGGEGRGAKRTLVGEERGGG